MSTFKVEIVAIDNIIPHENAQRLEIAQVRGWNVVVGKDNFRPGDKAIYFPVDSVLPPDLEEELFPPDSKIKLNKSRIRSIKIRGAISQGMLVPRAELGMDYYDVGADVTDVLGVKKYEPPEPTHLNPNSKYGKKTGGSAQINPHFSKYTDIENVKNYPAVFKDGEMCYISEKLHGTSARYGKVARHAGTGMRSVFRRLSQALLMRLGLMSKYEFVYGSRNVQLHTGKNKSWYEVDVYSKIAIQEDMEHKIRDGECVYGEIVGHNIQKNYNYGYGPNTYGFYVYDVKIDDRWLNYDEFVKYCNERGFIRVPELYVGPYSKEIELKHRDGDSTIGGQKIREGVVIKPLVEEMVYCGRKVLKSISDAYYLEDNDDFH